MTNEQRYLVHESFFAMEDGHSKKLKARHNKKLKNNEKRFYDSMGYENQFAGSDLKVGQSKRNGGKAITTFITNDKNYDASYGSNPASNFSRIKISRKMVQMKGSDLVGSHEYSHAMTDAKRKDMLKKGTDKEVKKADKAISKEDGFDKLSRKAIRKNKIKNIHDKKPDEMRADHYAITTTKGENNSNRLRKTLNELGRREAQSGYDRRKYELKRLNDDLDSDDKKMSNIKKKIQKRKLNSFENQVDRLHQQAIDMDKNDNLTRKKSNDYILSKKKEK